MKTTRVVKFAFLFIIVLAFVLNIVWSVRGNEDAWMYWTSRYLISSAMIILGFLMCVIPRQIRILIYRKDDWQEKSMMDKAGFKFYEVFN